MSFADSAGGDGDGVALYVIVIVVRFAGCSCWRRSGGLSDAGGTVPVVVVGFTDRGRYGDGESLGENGWKGCACDEEDGGLHFSRWSLEN
jgi:hypothetical protein